MIPLDCHENLAPAVIIAQISTARWRPGCAFLLVNRSSGRAGGGWSRKSTSEVVRGQSLDALSQTQAPALCCGPNNQQGTVEAPQTPGRLGEQRASGMERAHLWMNGGVGAWGPQMPCSAERGRLALIDRWRLRRRGKLEWIFQLTQWAARRELAFTLADPCCQRCFRYSGCYMTYRRSFLVPGLHFCTY